MLDTTTTLKVAIFALCERYSMPEVLDRLTEIAYDETDQIRSNGQGDEEPCLDLFCSLLEQAREVAIKVTKTGASSRGR